MASMANMASPRSTRFGDLLRRARQAAGLTQEELAERAGLSRRGINDLERGVRQHPRKDTVALLAAALGLTDEERTAFEAAPRRGTEQAASGPSTPPPPSIAHDEAAPPALPAGALPTLPSGTVTFLFTDIEGSTRLLQHLGSERYAELQTEHQRVVRAACSAHGGVEVDTQGDGSFVAFPTARGALAAAVQAQRTLAAHPWPDGTPVQVRMGLHTGTPLVTSGEGGYVGLDVVRAARIAAAGHGGQVLLSEATRVLTEPDLPKGASLRDLGEHRLKDLLHAEHLSQLVLPDLPAEFPPLKSLNARPHNLPIQPTLLLGREEAVATLTALLRHEDVRLVTLSGPGGVGKTRLGLQVAAELNDTFADGVWFVRLSRLTDPALVLPTIAQTLGLREMGSRSSEEMLRDYMHTRQLLLLLDNFEQVVAAAAVVAELLATSPSLKVLVTSRTVLHLRGEQEYFVTPLALPPAGSDPYRRPALEQVTLFPAVALFLQRAHDARPDFQVTDTAAPVVAAICAQLDGLPLAIELAAARVKLLPPPALLQRLEHQLVLLTGGARDLEDHQQTMQRTIAWSYDLLAPEEQRLFRRMAVFVGGCTLAAAEAVCVAPAGAAPLGLAVLDGLGALVDQSLVQQREETDGEPRFSLLHVIREYAHDQLEASGEAEALRQAHGTYYLALAEEVEPWLVGGPRLPEALVRLEREHDNLRAGLQWARRLREVALGLRLAGALSRYWVLRGQLSEGWEWLDGLLALEAAGAAVSGRVQAKALYGAGELATYQHDLSRGVPLLEQSLTLAREAGEMGLTVRVLNRLGLAAEFQYDLGRATARFEESLAVARELGDPLLIRLPLCSLGMVAYLQGDLQQAEAHLAVVVAMERKAGDLLWLAYDLGNLAATRRRQGDLPQTFRLLREAFTILRDVGERGWPLMVFSERQLMVLACALAVVGRGEQAARFLGAGTALHAAFGFATPDSERADIEAAVAPARAALGEAAWAAAFAAGRTLSLEEAVAQALDETT
jgi:predicted ATPase/class 3 adenylate cyclase/DNA-binding XRE family transcriptional regulator